MKKNLLTLLLLLLVTTFVSRADETRSYNFSRGMEAFEQGNYQEAAAYLVREVQENDNRSAWYFLAVIFDNNDQVGKANYMTANGEISEGTIVNLREVNFGGLSLTNVKASIVRSQAAPLLLGQSVLGKLGKIEIDNSRHVLKITHRVLKER